MEHLLHYTWKHKLFPLKELYTTKGESLEIIDTGLTNTNAGPDFFNAKIKINGVMWVGNVEIHVSSSDWFKHQHNKDANYDSVILHIAENIDADIFRSNGEPIPQLQLSYPSHVLTNYRELLNTDKYPPCYRIIPTLPKFMMHSWMTALQVERFEEKYNQLRKRLSLCDDNWEDAFFVSLARNFGFGINGDMFETWAMHLPFRAIDKHKDNLMQVEAIFFGQAGLLEDDAIKDEYYQQLRKEYTYLRHKFSLTPVNADLWKFLRLRPANFPHVRIAQLACLYQRDYGVFSQLMEADTLDKVRNILYGGAHEYWNKHYCFKEESAASIPKSLSKQSVDLLIINTVSPFLFAYGKYKGTDSLCLRATQYLEELKAENNHITRMWKDCGLDAANAADSQALIQLKKSYCDNKKCLYCRIGYEYLRKRTV